MKNIFVFFVVGIGFISCDRINDPYEGLVKPVDGGTDSIVQIDTSSFCTFANDAFDIELNDTSYNDTTSKFRKVLFEEFTGHKCGYCPPASKGLVAKTEGELKGKAIVMSIHAGDFATLTPQKGYITDFTTKEGNDLQAKYKGGNTAPSLMANRSNVPALAAKWDGIIDSLNKANFYDDPVVKFKIRNIYNQSIKTGRVDIDVKFLKQYSGEDFVMGVYITEDHVIAMQTDYAQTPKEIPNYDHRHVLRTAVTPTFGASFYSGNVSVNQEKSASYCYEIKQEWNGDNCSIIIFLGNANTNEIYQAEEIHVKSE